ncbi:single-stranded DNA-binding protein [Saccharothrix sp. ST-888]|uniref:single-stranded DNA-binding protein n=1 Tax=Saccharothrix sp. ST-888 TaxID=1427391 RepID=UPI0005ED0978|nr:single-stranded DNA-binding protein [Saccharothrix sp. ST-888]
MPLPTLTGIARLIDDPELRFTQAGNGVAKIRLAFNSRKKDAAGNWIDGDTLWIDGTVWQHLAENCAESLTKGMEVLVTGEVRTETWEKDGQKHSKPALLIRSIGPNLAYATARVQKTQRDGNSTPNSRQQPQTQHGQQTPANDPWATEQPPF